MRKYYQLSEKKQSLKSIINSINMGFIEFKDISALKITSDKYPDKFIKVVKVFLDTYIVDLVKDDGLDVTDIEAEYYSYIIFDLTDKKLSEMSLLELYMATKELIDNAISFEDNDWILSTTEEPQSQHNNL